MDSLDLVKIHFDPKQLEMLNLALGFLMFSVSFDIYISDFKTLFSNPKPMFVGFFSQYILFPLLTMAMIYMFRPSATVALGFILVSACPSGNMSNFMTNHARGNLPLSISLNSIITLGAAISTPLVFNFWSQFLPDKSTEIANIYIGFFDVVAIIAKVIVLPLVIGLVWRHYFPDFMARIKKAVSVLALVIFFGIIIGAFLANWQIARQHLDKIFLLVAFHNAMAMFLGYLAARVARLSLVDSRTIAIESGIHNTALGMILVFNFFNGIGGMAMVTAWWGIWDLVAVFGLASFWRRRPVVS